MFSAKPFEVRGRDGATYLFQPLLATTGADLGARLAHADIRQIIDFLERLDTPLGFWQRKLDEIDIAPGYGLNANPLAVLGRVAELVSRGYLAIIPHRTTPTSSTDKNTTARSTSGQTLRIVPGSEWQWRDHPARVPVRTRDEAGALIESLGQSTEWWSALLVGGAQEGDVYASAVEQLVSGRLLACRLDQPMHIPKPAATSAPESPSPAPTATTASASTARKASADRSAQTTTPATTNAGNPETSAERRCEQGCPIGMTSGEERLAQSDFTLPGPIPFTWERVYRSGTSDRDGMLGYGWSTPVTEHLRVTEHSILLEDADGRVVPFPKPRGGRPARNAVENLTIRNPEGQTWIVSREGMPDRYFEPVRGSEVFRLVQYRDRFDNHIDFHYDGEHLHRVTTSWGRGTEFSYNDEGRISAILPLTDDGPQLPPLVRYHYSDNGDLTEVTDRAGHSEHFAYRNHILTERVSRTGFRMTFEWDRYDIHGKCLRNGSDSGIYDYRFDWEPDQRQSTATDGRGATTRYRYNDFGLIDEEIDPEGGVTRYTYDEAGRLLTKIDPLGHREEFRYDEAGRLGAHMNALGQITTIEYDRQGNPTQLIDATGQKWQRKYDANGALIETRDPLGNKTTYRYDARGLPLQITDAVGHTRRFEWNEKAELVAEIDALQNRTEYTHDDLGRIVAVSTGGATTGYDYDPMGRITRVTKPDGRSVDLEWDASGNLTRFTDETGRITAYEYADGLNQVTQRTNPDGSVFRYEYDKERNLTALINENGERYQLKYDGNERLVEEIGFDGRQQRYSYNAAGQLTHRIDATERFIEYHRDPLGRLSETYGSDGQTRRFEYDDLGRLVAARNDARDLQFTYDAAGRLIEERQDDVVLKHQHDALGRRRATRLPDGREVRYTYNAFGGFTEVSLDGRVIARLERDASGRELKRLQGAIETATDYDPQGRLLRQQAINRQTRDTLIDRQYGYDREGRINRIKDLTRGETRFTYDPLDRLKRVTGSIDELFAFDPAGNILDREQRPEGGYVKGNRLQLLGDRHYEYDAAGNLIKESRGKNGQFVTEFEYSADNQLIAVTKDGMHTGYAYDALGRRVSKTGESQKTLFYWNGDVLLSELTFNDEGETKKIYLFEPYSFRPLAVEQDGRLYHYHLDHLGTPQELTDAQGHLAWQAHYKTYGNVALKPVETIENNMRFQGQYYDEESGLHYNRNRYYDPDAGRFVHQDPIRLLGGNNLYSYAPNPTHWIDPSGLSCKTQHEAAEEISKLINPTSIQENREYGGMIYRHSDGTFGYTEPRAGDMDSVDPGGPSSVPEGTVAVAYYHTHGAYDPQYDNENFSNEYDPVDKEWVGDIPYADYHQIDGYVATPKGQFKYYSHSEKKVYKLGEFD